MRTPNRATRRAQFKAIRCIERRTKVPGGVIAKLNPHVLWAMAANRDCQLGKNGVVLQLAA